MLVLEFFSFETNGKENNNKREKGIVLKILDCIFRLYTCIESERRKKKKKCYDCAFTTGFIFSLVKPGRTDIIDIQTMSIYIANYSCTAD